MKTIHVDVVYALPDAQFEMHLQLAMGATIADALPRIKFPIDVDWIRCTTGIWGKIKSANTLLRDGDRLEIYRPLIADPKEARRQRAKKTANASR